jgi:hypothetical protein
MVSVLGDIAVLVRETLVRIRLLALCAVAALAAPALAQAQPNVIRLRTTVAPGGAAILSAGTFPQGEFAFRLRAGSDGAKAFTLTQQRNGGTRFNVLKIPGPMASACQGAAGSLICSGITTPATPAGRTWTFRLTNASARPLSIDLRIAWRAVGYAG